MYNKKKCILITFGKGLNFIVSVLTFFSSLQEHALQSRDLKT